MQAGQCNYGRAVLVIVEYGDVELLLESIFDFEAFGAFYVLEIYASEGGRDGLDGLDEFCRGNNGIYGEMDPENEGDGSR